MAHDEFRGSGQGIYLTDNSEKQRLGFWQKFSTPIPSDLLRITGWLSDSPDRTVITVVDGKTIETRAAAAPPNVLFRLPEDPKSRVLWENYLHFLRLQQSRAGLVRDAVARATKRQEVAAAAVDRAWDRLFESVEVAHFELRQARAAHRAGKTEERRTHLVEARALVDKVRRRVSNYRTESYRLRDATRSLAYYHEKDAPLTLPGIYAEINAFLDMQCLTTASLASDEFRKRGKLPRAGPQSVSEALGIDGV